MGTRRTDAPVAARHRRRGVPGQRTGAQDAHRHRRPFTLPCGCHRFAGAVWSRGVRCLLGRHHPLGCTVRGAHRQRQAVLRKVHQAITGRSSLRTDLPRERHRCSIDQAPLTNDHRQDRGLSQDIATRTSRRDRRIRIHRSPPRQPSTNGCTPTTPRGPTSHWTWPPPQACSAAESPIRNYTWPLTLAAPTNRPTPPR